jgi:uncharacterized membrane protein YuzA (DUF378 family)
VADRLLDESAQPCLQAVVGPLGVAEGVFGPVADRSVPVLPRPGLVALFKFDLVAAVFGGMQFGEVNVASRIVYTLVGLSAAYLATQVPALVRASQPTPANPVRS